MERKQDNWIVRVTFTEHDVLVNGQVLSEREAKHMCGCIAEELRLLKHYKEPEPEPQEIEYDGTED